MCYYRLCGWHLIQLVMFLPLKLLIMLLLRMTKVVSLRFISMFLSRKRRRIFVGLVGFVVVLFEDSTAVFEGLYGCFIVLNLLLS